MLEIKDNEVLTVKTISTEKQPEVVIKTHHCPLFRVNIDAPTSLFVNEEGTVAFQWQRFDITQEQYVDDTERAEPITVHVENEQAEMAVVGGQVSISIMSEEAGEMVIRAHGQEVTVIINAQ